MGWGEGVGLGGCLVWFRVNDCVGVALVEIVTDEQSTCGSTLTRFHSHTHFVDDAPVWMNEEGMGIWRHFGYWYIGDYGEWPPVTFYRCVVGCEQGREVRTGEGAKGMSKRNVNSN